jgi:hypothetical protein
MIQLIASYYINNRWNRRVSATLSPILSLFFPPFGTLYHQVKHVLADEEPSDGSSPPLVSRQRRPGPKTPKYGIPAEHWPMVIHRIVEKKESLRKVAEEYGVSHETVRRVILAARRP